ncbi:MAG: DUF937 domain-containing protein [Flavipsychrobacter sp.]
MFDELMQIVQQASQKDVVENNNIPNEYNDAVMNEAGASIMGSLQNMLASGQTKDVVSLLKNENTNDSPAMGVISNNFIDSITEKLGIDKGVASNIAASILPQIINSFLNKAQDPNDKSFDMSNIINALNNNGSNNTNSVSDLISSVGGKFGLDKDKDGDVDLGDLMGMFK